MKLNFKKLALGTVVLAAAAFLIPSCNMERTKDGDTSYDRKEDSKEVAEETNDAILQGRKQERDAQFLVDAAEITLEEIKLAELAQTKTTDAEVKKISQMLANDHTKSLNELKELASKKGIAIPTTLTEDGQDAVNRLNDKKESDFNEDYCDMIVREHKRAINKFENASKNADDDEIKQWATTTLPKLRTNLDQADMCQPRDRDRKAAAGFK